MKKTILLGLSLLLTRQSLKSQSDYVLTNAKDTIKVKVISWNNQDFATSVKCEVNGVVKKFKSTEIIEFKSNDSYFETCKVKATLMGFKKKMFLERYTKGKISLYGITVIDKFMSSKKIGESEGNNRVTETYRITHKTATANVIFVKKDGGFKKLFGYSKLRAMTEDCDAYVKKFGQNVASKEYPYVEQILFYNDACK